MKNEDYMFFLCGLFFDIVFVAIFIIFMNDLTDSSYSDSFTANFVWAVIGWKIASMKWL